MSLQLKVAQEEQLGNGGGKASRWQGLPEAVAVGVEESARGQLLGQEVGLRDHMID